MKLISFQVKFYLLILSLLTTINTEINAQDSPVANYLQQAGDFAILYNGRIEPFYSLLTYESLPYYKSSDFAEASFIYKDNYYPNQKARLDLYREQLVLLPPEKRYGIIISSQYVSKVFIYGKTFVFLNSPKEDGIKKGFYIQLFEGNKIKLLCKESYLPQQKQITYSFDHKVIYYILYDDKYHNVKNKNSFINLFPEYKKQINQYVKDKKLNFRMNPEHSFTSLAVYCEHLLTSTK